MAPDGKSILQVRSSDVFLVQACGGGGVQVFGCPCFCHWFPGIKHISALHNNKS